MGPEAEQRRVRRDRSRQGRRRLPPGQRRPARAEPRARWSPCTPCGRHRAARARAGSRSTGARAVVIGRSDIVGKPMALLLLHRHATVTICHSRTRDLPGGGRAADILVAAIGRTAFVHARLRQARRDGDRRRHQPRDRRRARSSACSAEGSQAAGDLRGERGSIVVGDVHPEVADVAGALTPVPGGVGPLTIAMLLNNTVVAAERRRRRRGRPACCAVALTGGIATGKSWCSAASRTTASRPSTPTSWRARRSRRARRAPPRVVERFGAERVAAGRRASIARRSARSCSRDAAARADLEAIVHPGRLRRDRGVVRERCRPRTRVAVADIPLLFETGRERDFDVVVVAACPPEEQLRRLMGARRPAPRRTRAGALAAQWPIDEKARARRLRHRHRRHARGDRRAGRTRSSRRWSV